MTQLDMLAVDELVREIARALVDEPDAVEVETVSREENTVLRLRVAPVAEMVAARTRSEGWSPDWSLARIAEISLVTPRSVSSTPTLSVPVTVTSRTDPVVSVV